MASAQRRHWQKVRQEVKSTFVDKLGMPIDRGILDTVAIMRLLGINTRMSCEGHIDRSLHGPYIMFASAKAVELEKQIEELKEKGQDEEVQRLKLEAGRLNILERDKLVKYLDKFYASRLVPYNQRLIIMSVSPTFVGYLYCQGSERALGASKTAREKILAMSRKEMKAFTDFLKAMYYEDKSKVG
jgi:hypothetical protein